MNRSLVIRSPQLDATEVSWFSALCADDYEFLGVPDGRLRSSWEHYRDLVLTAERAGFNVVLLPNGYVPGQDTLTLAGGMAALTERILLLVAIRCGEHHPSMLGGRRAFLLFHLGGLMAGFALFQGFASSSDTLLMWLLPLFGFLTLGMHAGYAIYFPELYPTRLRSTGAGFCFNFARSATAVMLLVNGALQKAGLSFDNSASLLSLLFLDGIVLLRWAPETKGLELAN